MPIQYQIRQQAEYVQQQKTVEISKLLESGQVEVRQEFNRNPQKYGVSINPYGEVIVTQTKSDLDNILLEVVDTREEAVRQEVEVSSRLNNILTDLPEPDYYDLDNLLLQPDVVDDPWRRVPVTALQETTTAVLEQKRSMMVQEPLKMIENTTLEDVLLTQNSAPLVFKRFNLG